MKIEIDENSGFCFGVVNAIGKAEKELSEKGYVNSLGDIVHNKMEMQRLQTLGLRSVFYDTLPQIKGNTVFIRAHGEPPTVYKKINALGYEIVDATCPVVAKLQGQMKIAYQMMQEKGGQVVLLGKRGHAEVVGLSGQIDDQCIIIENIDELRKTVDFTRPVYLLSQTTQSLSLFNRMKEEIISRMPEELYIIKDSICRNVSNREPLLEMFAIKFDLVLFVSGADSSNGKALYEVCKRVNPNTKKIESEDDIDPQWLKNIESIGICGATSTPSWLMQRIANILNK
ncbi:MAG: 4-hydroxy-3-methylbut-2-enyl diphosphate reductase [Rikenellaceae bacterium]